jgi:hypothetical protein
MRFVFWIILMMCFYSSYSQKKNNHPLVVLKTSYAEEVNNRGSIGRIYEFMVEVRKAPLIIDSIWFGATPVPCDIYPSGSTQRITSIEKAGQFRISANRDLFRYFTKTDSTLVGQWFKPPFRFRGHAVLMYKFRDKRNYVVVQKASIRIPKKLRK